MKKQILGLSLIALLFSGCDSLGEKTTMDLICIDGKVYVDVYNASFVSADENIRFKKYLIRDKTLYFNDDNMNIKCIN